MSSSQGTDCILRLRRGDDDIFRRHDAPLNVVAMLFRASQLLPQQVKDAILCMCLWVCLSIDFVFFFPFFLSFSSQVSCREEEVHDWAEGAAAERAESVGSPEHHQPHHGGQVFPNQDVSRWGFWGIFSIYAGATHSTEYVMNLICRSLD